MVGLCFKSVIPRYHLFEFSWRECGVKLLVFYVLENKDGIIG